MGFWPGYILFCSFLLGCEALRRRNKRKVFLHPSTDFEQVAQRKQLLACNREKLIRLQTQEQALIGKKQQAYRKATSKLAATQSRVPQPGPAQVSAIRDTLSKAQSELEKELARMEELEKVISWTDSEIESLALVLRNVEQRAKNAKMLYGQPR